MENENLTPNPGQQWFHAPQTLEQPPQPLYPQPEQPVCPQPEEPAYQPPEQPAYQPPEQPVVQPPQPEYPPQEPVYQPEQPVVQPPQQANLPPEAVKPKKKTAKWKIIVPVVAGILVLALLAGAYFLFLRRDPNAAPDGEGILGTWRFDGGYLNDEYVAGADATLYVYDDQTAKLVIDGEQTAFTWKPVEGTQGEERFEATAEDGTVCTFRYFTDPEDSYCGDLQLYRSEQNMLYFIK